MDHRILFVVVLSVIVRPLVATAANCTSANECIQQALQVQSKFENRLTKAFETLPNRELIEALKYRGTRQGHVFRVALNKLQHEVFYAPRKNKSDKCTRGTHLLEESESQVIFDLLPQISSDELLSALAIRTLLSNDDDNAQRLIDLFKAHRQDMLRLGLVDELIGVPGGPAQNCIGSYRVPDFPGALDTIKYWYDQEIKQTKAFKAIVPESERQGFSFGAQLVKWTRLNSADPRVKEFLQEQLSNHRFGKTELAVLDESTLSLKEMDADLLQGYVPVAEKLLKPKKTTQDISDGYEFLTRLNKMGLYSDQYLVLQLASFFSSADPGKRTIAWRYLLANLLKSDLARQQVKKLMQKKDPAFFEAVNSIGDAELAFVFKSLSARQLEDPEWRRFVIERTQHETYEEYGFVTDKWQECEKPEDKIDLLEKEIDNLESVDVWHELGPGDKKALRDAKLEKAKLLKQIEQCKKETLNAPGIEEQLKKAIEQFASALR